MVPAGRTGAGGQLCHGSALEPVSGKQPGGVGKDCISFGHVLPDKNNQPNDRSVFLIKEFGQKCQPKKRLFDCASRRT
jgi:hypothetical protein